jgi:hypothetical protein
MKPNCASMPVIALFWCGRSDLDQQWPYARTSFAYHCRASDDSFLEATKCMPKVVQLPCSQAIFVSSCSTCKSHPMNLFFHISWVHMLLISGLSVLQARTSGKSSQDTTQLVLSIRIYVSFTMWTKTYGCHHVSTRRPLSPKRTASRRDLDSSTQHCVALLRMQYRRIAR